MSRGTTHVFDVAEFVAHLDAERIRQGLSWRGVARKSGCLPSTVVRLGQGRAVDVDAAGSLAKWAGLKLDDFVRPRPAQETP